MKRRGKTKLEENFQKQLGKRIESEIKKMGYASPYEFWIEKAGDHISRATLNYIINGQSDVKITTLKTLARLLKVKTRDLLDFE